MFRSLQGSITDQTQRHRAHMLDLHFPPPKRPRSRRLRKKLRIGEFQTLGFEYDLSWSEVPSPELQERFIDRKRSLNYVFPQSA
ncbi:50S ribosome-binding protein YggL [Hydrogenophaga atypica]|uniref:50S ribosome-binding protein YggL n=1 Tax=Hydrogenophaga atypica TaxID=249409 RepID=A0ABW2QWP7_9BURK